MGGLKKKKTMKTMKKITLVHMAYAYGVPRKFNTISFFKLPLGRFRQRTTT